MDNTTIVVTDVNAPLTIEAGDQFTEIKQLHLAIANYETDSSIYMYPNPAVNYFALNQETSKVECIQC
jgi:hypothetical protein